MPTIKETNYNLLGKQLASLIEDETNLIAILSNTSALLNDNLDQINWLGFYLIEPKKKNKSNEWQSSFYNFQLI